MLLIGWAVIYIEIEIAPTPIVHFCSFVTLQWAFSSVIYLFPRAWCCADGLTRAEAGWATNAGHARNNSFVTGYVLMSLIYVDLCCWVCSHLILDNRQLGRLQLQFTELVRADQGEIASKVSWCRPRRRLLKRFIWMMVFCLVVVKFAHLYWHN